MAMGSQFSLSLELTKLVPFGSLVNAAGHGFVRLLRDIQASGSDFVTEQDLAEVFGRNRVEPLFASTFRTAVKHSVIHQISGIAEMVIEGGAGPTVRRSLNEPGYFAMVVQLSLLTYTHELSGLTNGLMVAFQRRSQGSSEYVAPPRYDALKGALRAVREQTCGFMWELVISAVEKRLYPSVAWTDGSLYSIRLIPVIILQALLDSFTAIQHLPEHTRLQIASSTGIPTIIVWAHHVLGLTVRVKFNDESLLFGQGPETVYIDGDRGGVPTIALLNETNDPFFTLSSQAEDPTMTAVRRHTLRDYGTMVIQLQEDDPDRERSMIHAIATSCIKIAGEQNQETEIGIRDSWSLRIFPSVHLVISVLKLMFASNEDVIDSIDLPSELPSRPFSYEIRYPNVASYSNSSDFKKEMRLTHVVLAICMARGFDGNLLLHIDSLDEAQYMPCPVPNASSAFASLASLLQGDPLPSDNFQVDDTSVVSAWGWSLCLASLTCQDPSDARAELAFIRGCPARGGERRRYITDGGRSLRTEVLSGRDIQTNHSNYFTVVSKPGDLCVLESWTRPKTTRYFIGTTENAFEAVHLMGCEPCIADNKFGPVSVACGFRSMQETSWMVWHAPACDHPAALGQSITLPDGVWAFHGFGSPYNQKHDFPPNAVFAGLVAGDQSARWILTAWMLHQWRAGTSRKQVVCLRSRHCCFQCAIKCAKSCNLGEGPVGLVL